MNSSPASIDDDTTIKANTSMASYNDRVYHYDTSAMFQPQPPPRIAGQGSPYRQPSPSNSPTQPMPDQPDYSMQSSHYSIFSNANGSQGSLQNPASAMYQLDDQSSVDLIGEFQPPADLMYNISEYELTASLESLPTQAQAQSQASPLVGSHFTHPLLVNHAGADFLGVGSPQDDLPFTPTLNEFDLQTVQGQMGQSQSQNLGTVANQNLGQAPSPRFDQSPFVGSPQMAAQPQGPHPPPSMGTFTTQQRPVHTTPPSQRISKKASHSRLNVLSTKKNLVVSTAPSSAPLSTESSPGFGVSPLCHKYRGLDIQPPQPSAASSAASSYEGPVQLPPEHVVTNQNLAFNMGIHNDPSYQHQQPQSLVPPNMAPNSVFRHGSDSSQSSATSIYDQPQPPVGYPLAPGAMTPPSTSTPPRRKYSTLSEVSALKVKSLSRKQQESVGMMIPGSAPSSLPPSVPVPPAPPGGNPAPVATPAPAPISLAGPPQLMMHRNVSSSSVGSANSSSSELGNSVNQAVADGTKPKKHTRRRLLPRSKNGCWICRIKHLKCDEIRPECSSCLRFGIECDYSETKPDYVADKNLRREKLLAISLMRKSKGAAKPKKKKPASPGLSPMLAYDTGESPDYFSASLVNFPDA
ncbi:hypothetical protein DICA1_D12970 [Diutina catenulata]